MIVHLNLSMETAKRLSDKATQKGQTLEGLLQSLAEHEARGSSNGLSAATDSNEDEERPWRGVLVLDYPRQDILKTELEVNINSLPSLPPEILLDPRRLADDSE